MDQQVYRSPQFFPVALVALQIVGGSAEFSSGQYYFALD
jgi:hypothetical protein